MMVSKNVFLYAGTHTSIERGRLWTLTQFPQAHTTCQPAPGHHTLPTSSSFIPLATSLGLFGSARVVRSTVSPDDPAVWGNGKEGGWGLLSGHAPYSLQPGHRLLFLSPNVLSSVLYHRAFSQVVVLSGKFLLLLDSLWNPSGVWKLKTLYVPLTSSDR